MSTGYLHINDPVIPWSFSEQGDERFDKILKRVLLVFLLFSLAIPFLPLPKKKDELRPIPPQLARLIMERQKTSPPTPVTRKQDVKKKKKLAKKRERIKQKKVARARARASRSGLLALSNELSSLRDNSSLAQSLSRNLSTSGATREKQKTGNVIARNVDKSSGGINTAALSRDTGGTGLGSRSSTRVKSATLDGSRAKAHAGATQGARKVESLRLVFDRYKSAIYRIYSRELRKDPTLQGKVVLEITISAAGRVLNCRVVSSELDSKVFLRKLVARVKLFDFGPRPGGTAKVRYPIEFFPT